MGGRERGDPVTALARDRSMAVGLLTDRARIGVRDTPSFSTMANSAIRKPPASSPDRIMSRSRSCTRTWALSVPAG